MGLENFREKIEEVQIEKGAGELKKEEKVVAEKIRKILQGNADLNGLLVSDDLDMTEHQRTYYASQLKKLRMEAKEQFNELSLMPGSGIAEELRKVADGHDISKAA